MLIPSGTSLMPNMVETQVMDDHSIPIFALKLRGNIPGNVVINFCKILFVAFLATTSIIHFLCNWPLTETKKLVVPSVR